MTIQLLTAHPLQAKIFKTQRVLPVWVKFSQMKSNILLNNEVHLPLPVFRMHHLAKNSLVYADGIKRLFVLAKNKKNEIQFSKEPVFYIGTEKLKYINDYFDGIDHAIQNGDLKESPMDTKECLSLFMAHREEKLITLDPKKISVYQNVFNESNLARWISQ